MHIVVCTYQPAPHPHFNPTTKTHGTPQAKDSTQDAAMSDLQQQLVDARKEADLGRTLIAQMSSQVAKNSSAGWFGGWM